MESPLIRIVCISDTHNYHRNIVVPDGDILIHAGDITPRGQLHVLEDFNKWLGTLPHKHKVVIAGNHDFCFANELQGAARAALTNAVYLQDSSVVCDGIKIYGTPWQPWFHNWAFNAYEPELLQKWEQIPEDTDVLVVHGPPYMHGDLTSANIRTGSPGLLARIMQVQPRLVVTGHIHEDCGVYLAGTTTIINASICTLQYKPTNRPVVYTLSSHS